MKYLIFGLLLSSTSAFATSTFQVLEEGKGACFYQDQFFDRSGKSYNQNGGVSLNKNLYLMEPEAPVRVVEARDQMNGACREAMAANAAALCNYSFVSSVYYSAQIATSLSRSVLKVQLGYTCVSGKPVKVHDRSVTQ